jgi:hypothetical protein
MSRRLISRVGFWAARWPFFALLLVGLLTVLAVTAASKRLRIEMDVASLLPQDSSIAQDTRRAEWEFGRHDYLLGVLEIRPDAPEEVRALGAEFLLRLKPEVEAALLDPIYFRRAGNRDPLKPRDESTPKILARLTEPELTLIENALLSDQLDKSVTRVQILARDGATSETMAQLARDPFGIEGILAAQGTLLSGPLRAQSTDGAYLSKDGQMLLLMLWPNAPSTNLLQCRLLNNFLHESVEGLYRRNPTWEDSIKISFIGAHIENAEGESDILNDVVTTSLLSLAAVLVLFFIAFRQPEAVLFVAIPLVVGVAWTLGVASIFVERITQTTLTFAAIMIGLSIDFSIYLYHRFLEDVRAGATVEAALQNSIMQTGPTIVAGAVTSGAAFFGMTITRFEGFRELGLFGGIGIITCLLAMALTLPALMRLFSRMHRVTRGPIATFGLKKVSFTVFAYPRMTVAAGLCVAAYLGIHATQAKFNEDFQALRQPSDSYLNLLARIGAHYSLPGSPVLAIHEASTLEEALAKNDRLFDNVLALRSSYRITGVDSLRTVYPSADTQRITLRRFASLPVDSLRAQVASRLTRADDVTVEFFEPGIKRLAQQVEIATDALAQNAMPITLSDTRSPAFYQALQRHLVSVRGEEKVRVITRIYPERDQWNEGIPAELRERLGREMESSVLLLGNDVLSTELRSIVTRDLAYVLIVIITGIMAYLTFYFGSFLRALLAITPTFFALLCVLGMMYLLDIQFNYVNVIAFPMLIGVAVDSAIHLMARYYEGGSNPLQLAIEKTGRAVIITQLTSAFGFGTLCLASFQGIREIGLLSIIGIISTLFASLVFLPALIHLLDPKITYRGGRGDEIG